MIVQEPVQAAIWHCLNHYDFKDAVFLAERLCSEVETDETIFILATSYYRSNLMHQAYWLLKEKSRRSPHCRYLMARCAYQLKKYSEAECALTNGFGEVKNFDEIVKDFGEIACFALQLIAQICVKTERIKIAADALRRVLKLNPFMWHSYSDLLHLGEQVDPTSIFQISSSEIFNTCQGNVNTNAMILFGGAAQGLNDSGTVFGNNFNSGNTTTMAGNNDSYILTTPVEQHSLAPSVTAVPSPPLLNGRNNSNMVTPNNNNSLNMHNVNINLNNNNNNISVAHGALTSSMTLLRGNMSGLMMLDDTPVCGSGGGGGGVSNEAIGQAGGMGMPPTPLYEDGTTTPLRKQFKYLGSAYSPATPSFGVLSFNSPYASDSSFIGGGVGLAAMLNQQQQIQTPSPQTLAEVHLEQHKVVGKKMRSGHIGGGLISRKDAVAQNAVAAKPAVFTQTGNITPRTPTITGNITTANPMPPNAVMRRSSRLSSHNAYSVKENNKSPNIPGSKFVQPRSPPRKTKSRIGKICLNNEMLIDDKSPAAVAANEKHQHRKDKEKIETITSSANAAASTADAKVLLNNSLNNAQTIAHHVLALKKQSAEGLMALLRDLGEGYKHLSHYHCKMAIKQLEGNIPKHHLASSWVQSLLGIANYELQDYEAAVTIFKRIHDDEPHRLDSMEIYSSSLWQLQKEVDLSALAQDLMQQDKLSPVTWCVAGNCFSLHKEHETAIKFFKRAVQVDPDFVYSYTLLGHELVLTEELEKAMDYFRAAVVRDSRHYNAWFGIGAIYSKQEKYALAELHYIKALKIYPQNSVILVHIGAMQYFMQKKEQALQTLNIAATLDPKNPLARFHRGSIFFSLGRHQEALRELEELKDIVPKESVVFYLIGKIHKALGNVDLALMHFSWATDLDPKGANNHFKDAFDSVSHTTNSCPPATNIEQSLDADLEPVSDRSDDSTQAQQDINYDSDVY